MPQGLDSEPELHYSIEEALEQQFWSDAEGNFPEPRYPSIVLIPTQMAGGRVVVVPITKVLIVMPRWLFSNGQAGNWNRLPQGYQDARTLSFPMR